MDHMNLNNQTTSSYNPTSTPSALGIRRDSHSITKVKPKIRIIHIFAPEIIKTDVANFRELVQRLTGKPTDNQNNTCKKKPPRAATKKKDETVQENLSVCDKKVEFRGGIREKMNKDEENIWHNENSEGFLGGFSEFDGLMQGFGEFPMFTMDSSHTTTHHQDFGETHRLG